MFNRYFGCFVFSSVSYDYNRQILEVVSALVERPPTEMAEQIHRNTCTLFNWPC